MTTRLRPALSMSETYGPDRVFVARPHPRASDWLPQSPVTWDSYTGSKLCVAGDMPIVCSKGFITQFADDLLGEAGIEPASRVVPFAAGEELDVIADGGIEPRARLVLQNVYPPDALAAERYWIDPALLSYLNNKGNLAALAPAEHVPPRLVAERAGFFEDGEAALPAVLKAVTDQSSAGGYGVMICRTSGDLRAASRMFEPVERIVVERLLDIVRSPCLNFAVLRSGEVRYIGFADQDVTDEGKHCGNWIDPGAPLWPEAIEPAMEVVRRAADMGYRGFVGIDVAITRDKRVYLLDLNFRMNASTAAVLLEPAIRDRLGPVTIHVRKLQGRGAARELTETAREFLRRGRIIPTALFDSQAAGYEGEPARLHALILGDSRADVLKVDAELAAAGIA